jgi:hypothetical protein
MPVIKVRNRLIKKQNIPTLEESSCNLNKLKFSRGKCCYDSFAKIINACLLYYLTAEVLLYFGEGSSMRK